ncbi:MAG: PTS transporter subunit EIIB [Actinomycetaceae bacterium]|nr:PTS transporter subunit EIIB [Actinomycetaceae bacterium]
MSAAEKLVQGLGGPENIEDLESCIVRIRAIISDPLQVDEAVIRETNPIAVVSSGRYVQIIVGPASDDLVEEMQQVLEGAKVHP